jgi:hypothetical protein
VYPHWLAETFGLTGIYLLTTNGDHPNRDLTGGVFIGLSAATIQSLGLPILATSIIVLAMPGIAQRNLRKTYARPLRIVGGALFAISPVIIYLGLVGALDPMWYHTVKWVLNHYPEGQTDAFTQGYGAYVDTYIIQHGSVEQPWRGLAIIGLKFVNLLPALAICGGIIATLQIFINRWRRPMDYDYLLIGTSAIAVYIPLLFGITRVDIVHIAFIGCFGLCGVAIALQPLVTWRPYFRLPVGIVWVAIGLLIVVNFSAKTVMTYRPSREKMGWKGEILKQGMASWMNAHLGPNERIVTAYGGLQYLYIRRAATGFTFLPFDTPRYYSDEQWRKLGGQILKTLPPILEVTRLQWLQIIQRTPELKKYYQLINNRYLMRIGFIPIK